MHASGPASGRPRRSRRRRRRAPGSRSSAAKRAAGIVPRARNSRRASSGVTRCSIVTPATVEIVQPFGTCRRATVRMFRAASAIARRTSAGTVRAARSISARRDLNRSVEAVEPARVLQQRPIAAIPHVGDDPPHPPRSSAASLEPLSAGQSLERRAAALLVMIFMSWVFARRLTARSCSADTRRSPGRAPPSAAE